MKKVILIASLCIYSSFLFSCTKEKNSGNNSGDNEVIETRTNINVPVKPGERNCQEAINGDIRIKLASAPVGSSAVDIQFLSKTTKLYPMGGYILVYHLSRSGKHVSIEFKTVHTSCGNPGVQAFMPAAATIALNQVSPGTYPVEIRVNGKVSKGSLIVPQSLQPVTLQIPFGNGVIIE